MTKKITKLMLNGEEYEIREYQAWWQPGANTIAYYPLSSDTNDYSWNNRNWTNNWVTFSDGVWVFDGSSYVELWSGSWTDIQSNMTISAWFKWNWNSTSWWDNFVIWKQEAGMLYFDYWYYAICIKTNDNNTINAWFYNGSDFNTHPLNFRTSGGGSPTLWPVAQANVWYHLVLTNDWTTKKAYINWQLAATESAISVTSTKTISLRIWSATYYNSHTEFNWNISQVILEDKTWTATEVEDYYNQTKWNYWIN